MAAPPPPPAAAAQPTPPPQGSSQQQQQQQQQQLQLQTQPSHPSSPRLPALLRYMSWVAVVAGPYGLFRPPRPTVFQGVVLATGTSVAGNVLVYNYTGEFFWQRVVRRWQAATTSDKDGGGDSGDSNLPAKAQRTQQLLRSERLRREAALPPAEREAARAERHAREWAQRGWWSRMWGGEEGWMEERALKEREVLDSGGGYGELIMAQVKEVLGAKKEEEKEGEKQDGGERKEGKHGEDEKKS